MENSIKKAMVFAAGLGTRLKPFTDEHPKALYIINGKTLLERNVEYLIKYGIKEIIINVHHFANQIIEFVNSKNSWGINITYSNETDELLDTGGGLLKAASFFENTENFILYNADILTNMPLDKMIAYHLYKKPLVTLAVSERKSSRYFLMDENDTLCGWVNEHTGEQKIRIIKNAYYKKAFNGIHIMNTKLLENRKEIYKFSITDWYLDICNTAIIKGFNSSSNFIDVGKMTGVEKAKQLFR